MMFLNRWCPEAKADQSAGKLKLISKGLNISGELLLDQGFGFLIIVITVSGPIIGSSSVGSALR